MKTITARLPVLLSKYADSSGPIESLPAHSFTITSPESVKDGALTGHYAADDMGWRFVGWADVRIELLPNEDINAAQVEALKAQKAAVLAKAQAEATRIERQIQSLLAISMDVTA